MAKLDPNELIGILRGKLGGLVFVRNSDGTITVRHSPVREAEFTPAELGSQASFRRALAYVSRIKRLPDEYAVYQAAAKARGKRACDLANADFRYPPTIKDVELSAYTGKAGEPIRVEAVDDFAVTSVTLTFTQLDGLLLEHGAAILDQTSAQWVYLTQASVAPSPAVVIHVTASDQPGNLVTKTFPYALIRPGP